MRKVVNIERAMLSHLVVNIFFRVDKLYIESLKEIRSTPCSLDAIATP